MELLVKYLFLGGRLLLQLGVRLEQPQVQLQLPILQVVLLARFHTNLLLAQQLCWLQVLLVKF
jgi:hypothetical protein